MKAKTHQRYYANGQRVPGTTTILGVLGKPALIYWAWDLGTQGIDYRKYSDELAKVGTLVHERIENHIKNKKTDFDDYSKNQIELSDIGFEKFIQWEKEKNPKYLMSELQLSSVKHRFGGTIDLYAVIDGKMTLVDFKTSKAIYDDQFCQVSAYAELLREHDMEVDQVMILRIGRNADEGFEVRTIDHDKEKKYFEVFEHCLNIYGLKKKLKWR